MLKKIWKDMLSLVPDGLGGYVFFAVVGLMAAAVLYCWVWDFLSKV